MRRSNRSPLPLLVIALALLMAACATADDGGGSSPTSSLPNASTSTDAPTGDGDSTTSTEGQDGGSGGTTTTEGSTDAPDGPPAPDFTLALGVDGAESFMLSQEVMPVFMVFWAEW